MPEFEESRNTLLRRGVQRSMFRSRLDTLHKEGPIFSRGQNSILCDVDGNEYLDFNSGQMSAVLGHNHPRIIEAMVEAGNSLIHSSTSYYHEYEIELAEELNRVTPGPLQKSFFLLSGSDANEAALDIARVYTGRHEVVSPHVSFHGLSDATRSVTYATFRKNYPLFVLGSHAMIAPYCYRCPLRLTYPDCDIACLDASFDILDNELVSHPAAVITEPLFSAGGVIEPPPGWLAKLKRKCEERGSLLVLDECQTGLAKLGTMWAHQQEGVTPDIITMAKHFGGGVPIAGVMTTVQVEETVIERGFIFGHSNSSDPLGTIAARAALRVIEEEKLAEKAQEIGRYWRNILEELQKKHPLIGDIRGRGLIHGIELVYDRSSKQPANEEGKFVERYCLQHGLLLSLRGGGGGGRSNVLRFVPPFTTTYKQLDSAGQILDDALTYTERSTRER